MKTFTLLALFFGILYISPLRWYLFPAPGIELGDYTLKVVKPFEIEAQIIIPKAYVDDHLSPVSPVDFGLVWGAGVDDEFISQFEFNHSKRLLYVRSKGNGYANTDEQMGYFANMHIIPADSLIKEKCLFLKEGDLVYFEGYLVDIYSNIKNSHLRSSRNMSDRGRGSCEIVYVTDIFRY